MLIAILNCCTKEELEEEDEETPMAITPDAEPELSKLLALFRSKDHKPYALGGYEEY
jgi:hypothetical protein